MRIAPCMACPLLVFIAACCPQGAAGQQTVADSGTTVVSGNFPRGKVVVKIRTAMLDQNCSKSCPTSTDWAGWGGKHVVVVQKVTIFVNGHPVFVPLGAYSNLFAPERASLRSNTRGFVLRVNGGDASESYFIRLYFNQGGVHELEVYSSLDPTHPTEVAHFYAVTIGP